MAVVQPCRGTVVEVELAPAGVRSAGLGHGDGISEVQASVVAFALICDGVARATHAVGAFPSLGVRAAALDHEVRLKTVESDSVVVIALNQRNEIGHGVWGVVLKKFNKNRTFGGLDFYPREIVGCFFFGSNGKLSLPKWFDFFALPHNVVGLSAYGNIFDGFEIHGSQDFGCFAKQVLVKVRLREEHFCFCWGIFTKVQKHFDGRLAVNLASKTCSHFQSRFH